MGTKVIRIKGKKYSDWIIYHSDKGASLCVGSLLVSELKTLEEAIQDMIDIENEPDDCNE